MKPLLAILAFFTVSLSPLFAEPATTVPSDSNSKTVYTQLCKNRLNGMKGKTCDILFIGDSITQVWDREGKEVWKKHYADRHAFNFGVGADRTQNVLWRLENLPVKGLAPKVAVIMIGTNNFADPPADVAAGVKAVVAKVQKLYAGVKVIVVSITPNARANQTMMAANAIIKSLADDQSVFYLDLVPLMPKVGNSWKGLLPDRLHFSPEGYEIWATAMEPLLTKLLGGSH
jgi:lysophospholipase L1-like esterase